MKRSWWQPCMVLVLVFGAGACEAEVGSSSADQTEARTGGDRSGAASGFVDPFAEGAGDGPAAPDDPECGGFFVATLRDFSESHPDFQSYSNNSVTPGLVESLLGKDGKPVYAHDGPTEVTSGPEAFEDWYRTREDVNVEFTRRLEFEVVDGISVFDDDAFFPLDGEGFGNEGNPHNYHFTTEIHARFSYQGGENFRFDGDDDVWIFINDRLAIDLGGVHPERSQEISLDAMADELNIEVGQTYDMDMFHAERRTVESNFRVETNILCFSPVGPIK
ncbi:MAG: fibro-slime domain-containing protein [Myxococcota bacterium]